MMSVLYVLPTLEMEFLKVELRETKEIPNGEAKEIQQ